jgi:uncharacterized membrane protein YtjA (UPF0391 family)
VGSGSGGVRVSRSRPAFIRGGSPGGGELRHFGHSTSCFVHRHPEIEPVSCGMQDNAIRSCSLHPIAYETGNVFLLQSTGLACAHGWHGACNGCLRDRSTLLATLVEIQWRNVMLHYALVFLVVAIIAAVLGFGGIAGAAAGIAKILFLVFLVLFVVSLVAGRRGRL